MEAPKAKVSKVKMDELSARTKEATVVLKQRNEKLMVWIVFIVSLKILNFIIFFQKAKKNVVDVVDVPSKENIYLMFEQFRKIVL